MDDDYESEWGDIDDQDLMAAVDEAERRASSSTPSREQNGVDAIYHLKVDPGRRGGAISEAIQIPKRDTRAEVHYPSLASSANTLASGVLVVEGDRKRTIGRQDTQRNGGGASKRSRIHVKGGRQGMTGMRIMADKKKWKTPENEKEEGGLRQKIEYSGTSFPRLYRICEDDLLDAVVVAQFSLNLMGILTSLLREFMGANVTLYPQNLRQNAANDINKMAHHAKANDLFHGWDFLALANFMLKQRLPPSVLNKVETLGSLRVLKTTMRWTFAHASLEDHERKHPIELSLWAINTLLLIENLGVSMSYAARVITLNQNLWSLSLAEGSESSSMEN